MDAVSVDIIDVVYLLYLAHLHVSDYYQGAEKLVHLNLNGQRLLQEVLTRCRTGDDVLLVS